MGSIGTSLSNCTTWVKGPSECQVDAYHLCARHLVGRDAPFTRWWPYNLCLWENEDALRCFEPVEPNGSCTSLTNFTHNMKQVHAMCAAVAGMNAQAIDECAQGDLGVQLVREAFAKVNWTLGFAPKWMYVNGELINTDCPKEAGCQVNLWASHILEAICTITDNGPAACAQFTNNPSNTTLPFSHAHEHAMLASSHRRPPVPATPARAVQH